MKIILDSGATQAAVCWPTAKAMRAFTQGGLGKLPGDAVTEDLSENPEKRLEVSRSMPLDRAIENMIRDGREAGFAQRYLTALLSGGETDATALDLVREHAFRAKDGQIAAEPTALPADRFFRNAWRLAGGVVVVDLQAARRIFAERVLEAKAAALAKLTVEVETTLLLGVADASLEAQLEALKLMDLRALGGKIMAADSASALKALWPVALR
jgi:hypothetical protein